MIKFLLLFLVLLNWDNYKTQQFILSPKEYEKTETIYINKGETKDFQDKNIKIKFNRILEISRCPKGATCKWADFTVIEIELSKINTKPTTYQLSDSKIKDAVKHYPNEIFYNGNSIVLKEISPYPNKKEDIDLDNYKIGISIKKEIDQTNPTMK